MHSLFANTGVVHLPWIGVALSMSLLSGQAIITRLYRYDISQHKAAFQGTVASIKRCNAIRLVTCVTLFCLQLKLAQKSRKHLSIGLCLVYGYCSILALVVSVSANRRTVKIVSQHLVYILLFSWLVFVYRNIWPLATYVLLPEDRADGALGWFTGLILTIAAVVIPLSSPREYIPRKAQEVDESPNPEQTASVFSRVTFNYMDPLVLSAYRSKAFSGEDLPPICDDDDTEVLVERAYKHLDPSQNKSSRHIFFSLLKVFMWEHIEELLLLVLMVLADFMQPFGINRLLTYVESGGRDAYVHPWVWCLALFVSQVAVSMTSGRYMLLMGKIISRTQGVLTQLIFDHALRVRAFVAHEAHTTNPKPTVGGEDQVTATSDAASVAEPRNGVITEETTKAVETSHNTSLGSLNNLIATDITNIDEGQYWILTGFYTPAQIMVSIAFLYAVFDWSALVGIATMLILLPIPGFLVKYSHEIQVERMKKSDIRVESVTEVVSGAIRMVKLFGWETQMSERIDKQRREEIRILRKYKLFGLTNVLLSQFILIASMVATFVTFTVFMRRELTASRIFSSVTVFQWLQRHFQGISEQLPGIINAKVSLDRIDDFLKNSDLVDRLNVAADTATTSHFIEDEVVGIRGSSFTWSRSETGACLAGKFKLSIEGEVAFHRGRINLIIGQTGSGKTSMLMALLGEMHYYPASTESFVKLPRSGGVAYQAQESWIMNESIRDNILFGMPYQQDRYNKVIRQCALESDLALFKAGDLTEVGERGVTLSGGQKARVTLARAVYSAAEILLLDDVFAALDTHTAVWIVKECLQGELVQGRTVILATHSIALLKPVAHFVVSLTLDGRVNSQGSLQNALEKDQTLLTAADDHGDDSEEPKDQLLESDRVEKVTEDGKLIAEEELSEGHVGWSAAKLLFLNMASSPQGLVLFWISFLTAVFGIHSTSILYTWVLGRWARQYEEQDRQDVAITYYLSIYLSLVALNMACIVAKSSTFIFGSLRASQILHRLLIDSVLRSTLRWLDKTPASRIIARCTQDIASVDGPAADWFSRLMDITAVLILRLATIIFMSPLFTIPSLVLGALGLWIGQMYMKAQLAVKREMSNARAPVLGHFGAVVAGIVSVRAYGAQAAFQLESRKRINRWVRAARTFSSLNKWVSIRSEVLAATFNAGLATYLVYGSSLDASAIGFTLAISMVFSNLILWWVRYFNEFEINGNSLERIQQYLNIEHEPASTLEGVPPAYWPASGHLKVENLSARYSEKGPSVLQDISFEISSGERVGIVGRTGSGKSSLTLALLRCILTEGNIYFDGVATDTLNLEEVRTAITIIPQVPELLSGTLRENVDPFLQHDDAYLNEMLRAAGLFSLDRDKFGKQLTLDSPISSAGKNLSVGQRQMIALARAMVRRSRLLILDEATSAIDYETDSIIQASLRKEVAKDVSVLTIAHRLHTVMDSDKIIVLDAGRIIEFGRPRDLLQNPNGGLRALVDSSADREELLARVAER